MFKNKPVTLLITAGLTLLLIAAAGVYPLFFGNIRAGGARSAVDGTRPQMQLDGQVPNNGSLPSNGNLPSGMSAGRRGLQNNQTGSNYNSDGQFPQGSTGGNFTGTMPTGTTVSVKLMLLLQEVLKAGAIIVIALGLLALTGIFLGKDWGRKLSFTPAIVAIILSGAGLFTFAFGLSLWIKIAAIVIAVSIMVFSSLPKSRIMATVPA